MRAMFGRKRKRDVEVGVEEVLLTPDEDEHEEKILVLPRENR